MGARDVVDVTEDADDTDDTVVPHGEGDEDATDATGGDLTGADASVDEEAPKASSGASADSSADASADEDAADGTSPTSTWSAVKVTLVIGLVTVVALGGLVGWLGYQAYQAHELETRRNHFLEVGRQGALNLTTIDYEHVDADVQRVLDGASGTFYDQFEKRAAPYAELVKQVKSKSVGTITESGVESATKTDAEVLVAVTVNTVMNGQPEASPRSFRMRIQVRESPDGQAKVSSVEFVP